jgi:hypothetical protein
MRVRHTLTFNSHVLPTLSVSIGSAGRVNLVGTGSGGYGYLLHDRDSIFAKCLDESIVPLRLSAFEDNPSIRGLSAITPKSPAFVPTVG